MRALCLGSAQGVFEDARQALELFRPDVVIACNDIGAAWPEPLDHWASLHPQHFRAWRAERLRRGHPVPPDLRYWTCETKDCPRGVTELPDARRGSSGLLTVRVAKRIGARRIVLAGIPLTASRHIDGLSTRRIKRAPWGEAEKYRPAWLEERTTTLRGVRSMSGWTRDLLGAPDRQWLRCRG